jgi:ankyrin repeat protein
MKIHRYAQRGDRVGVQQELMQGVSINVVDDDTDSSPPKTPLQWAIASPIAGIEMVEFLIAQGATLTLAPKQGNSDLKWAILSGRIEKVQLLLDLGADINEVDEHGYDALINSMFSEAEGNEIIALVKFLIAKGAPLNGQSSYGESALSLSSRYGCFEMIQVLLAAGGDRSFLGWTDLMQAIALGTLPDVEAQLAAGADLTAVDLWERTPWLLSLDVEDEAKAKRLLAAGANPAAVGRCGKLPLMYVLESGNLSLLEWLIGLGIDVNASDKYGGTALMSAVQRNQVEAAAMLLAAGAIASKTSTYDSKAISQASSIEMVEQLLAAGEDLADLESTVRCLFTKVEMPEEWELDCRYYQTDKHPRFGDRNPEEMLIPFWREMVKFRRGAYATRSKYGDTDDFAGGAVWCFDRFGQSITRLPDGRAIEIAGEHEDYYDPDFYIYNDVVVYDGRGEFTIYGYPKAIFPPTDFHTATLIDDWIYIIGNLGYGRDRIIGETPVYRLNCTTLAIEAVVTQGDSPGWISRHHAVLQDRHIHISGGLVWTMQNEKPTLIDNSNQYILDVVQGVWHLHSWGESVAKLENLL